jgi:hypothetical protein
MDEIKINWNKKHCWEKKREEEKIREVLKKFTSANNNFEYEDLL